jgi:hypothetical protein
VESVVGKAEFFLEVKISLPDRFPLAYFPTKYLNRKTPVEETIENEKKKD